MILSEHKHIIQAKEKKTSTYLLSKLKRHGKCNVIFNRNVAKEASYAKFSRLRGTFNS